LHTRFSEEFFLVSPGIVCWLICMKSLNARVPRLIAIHRRVNIARACSAYFNYSASKVGFLQRTGTL
jgi:hypothetical protein